MRTMGIVMTALVAVAIGATRADAQDDRRVGVTMTSGSAIGIYADLTPRLAVRPTFSWNYASNEIEDLSDSSTTAWALGISGLYFLRSWENTRLYVSPQYAYGTSTASVDGEDDEFSTDSHQFSGMVGAQHGLGSRFAVFGEIGLGWSWGESSSTSEFVRTSKTNGMATRGLIGGILFF